MGAHSAPEHSRERAASSLPARAGVGFKSVHLADIEASARDVGFFEIHAENYMDAGGAPHAQLMRLREIRRSRSMASACRSAALSLSIARIFGA